MASANTNELYKKHPLRWETILARIRKQRKSLEGIDASESIAELPLAAAAINFKTAIRRLLAIAVTMLLGALLIRTTTVGPACKP